MFSILNTLAHKPVSLVVGHQGTEKISSPPRYRQLPLNREHPEGRHQSMPLPNPGWSTLPTINAPMASFCPIDKSWSPQRAIAKPFLSPPAKKRMCTWFGPPWARLERQFGHRESERAKEKTEMLALTRCTSTRRTRFALHEPNLLPTQRLLRLPPKG